MNVRKKPASRRKVRLSALLILAAGVEISVGFFLFRERANFGKRVDGSEGPITVPADEVSKTSPEPGQGSSSDSRAGLPRTEVFPSELIELLTAGEAGSEATGVQWESLLEKILDVPTALNAIQVRASSEARRQLELRLIRRWAETDPRKAADWVLRKASGPARLVALKTVAISWANQNLAEATQWGRQLEDSAERTAGLMAIAYEAARNEPLQALDLVGELPVSPERDDLMAQAATQWATTAPEAAADWATRITDRAVRERLLAGIAVAWGEIDPVAAAACAVRNLSVGKEQEDAVIGIVQRWVQNEPEKAAAWVRSFPETTTLSQTALETLVKLWSDRDLEPPAKWLASLEAGRRRDTAITAYVAQITARAPVLASQWAERIDDAAAREHALEDLGELWLENDPTAARAWIAEAPLPDPIKLRLLSPPSE